VEAHILLDIIWEASEGIGFSKHLLMDYLCCTSKVDCITVAVQLTGFGRSRMKIFTECQQDISPLIMDPHVWELCQESFFQSCHVNYAIEFDSKLLQP